MRYGFGDGKGAIAEEANLENAIKMSVNCDSFVKELRTAVYLSNAGVVGRSNKTN